MEPNNEAKTSVTREKKIHHGAHILYLILVGLVFFGLAIVFMFFPRSTYSEMEKRDLATFPETENALKDPRKFTGDISSWFSDTEPYRDVFMSMSQGLRDAFRLRLYGDEETVSFKPTVNAENTEGGNTALIDNVPVAQGNPLADENAKVANSGIVIVGSAPNARALTGYGGVENSATPYIDVMAKFRSAFPDVQLYAVVIPTATEFYLPKKAESASKPQKPSFNYLREHLDPSVKYVDVYAQLAGHTKEDIFLRTDHHWSPRGAYYAAKALAASAGVPFKDLSNYDEHVVHGYVGSMYGYSKDIAVKNSPEDFYYYTPRGANEKTTYITYSVNKDYQVTSERGPYSGEFFHHFPDGSGGAYCTFMGGDCHIVKVETEAPNSRRLLIIKDSYGNPIPAYLFYSFNQIHVIDFRYFTKNLKQYVADNGITDIALAFNIFSAASGSAMGKVKNFLTQSTYTPKGAPKSDKPASSADSKKEKKDSAESKNSKDKKESEKSGKSSKNDSGSKTKKAEQPKKDNPASDNTGSQTAPSTDTPD